MADKRRVLLEDVLTQASVQRLEQAYEDGVDLMVGSAKEGVKAFTIHKDQLQDVGEPILRYVWHVMRASAVYDKDSPFPGFPYRNRVPQTHIFRRYMGNEKDPNQYTALLGSVNRLLVGNGLVRVKGRGITYLPDSWPPQQQLRWTGMTGPYVTPVDQVVEKRIKEEADKPVRVYRNLRTVKLPSSFDAESVKQWIKTFVPAALALQDEYDKLRAKVSELEDKVEQASRAVEQKDWDEVGEELASVMGGGAGGHASGSPS